MAEQTRPSNCLNVAIDHRLLSLFQPLCAVDSGLKSNHVRLLRNMAGTLRRNDEKIAEAEVAISADLAGPATAGGICFVLQQPANNHPCHLGIDSVVESSPTLKALLLEIWPVVSCGAPRPTIIDSLPFVRPIDQIDLSCKNSIEEKCFAIIQEKRPDVVVCMWRRKQNSDGVRTGNPGNMDTLEGLGIGRTFRSMEFELRPGFKIRRVNAFHPSFAINYHPHISCFRQLLILEVAQACGLYRGQWHNEFWMDELRSYCQDKVRKTLSSGQV